MRKGARRREIRLGDGHPLESFRWAGSLVVAQVLFHFELRPERILTGRQVKVTALSRNRCLHFLIDSRRSFRFGFLGSLTIGW